MDLKGGGHAKVAPFLYLSKKASTSVPRRYNLWGGDFLSLLESFDNLNTAFEYCPIPHSTRWLKQLDWPLEASLL